MPDNRIEPPARRTAPCPCGSGRRYKDCHGALLAPVSVAERMYAALAAQQQGRLAEAARLYDSVLVDEPVNFDALHMLGVIEYERGRFDHAERRLRDALAIVPHYPAAHGNLRLIVEGRKRAEAEKQLCRELLRDVARLYVSPIARPIAASSIAVVVACDARDIRVTRHLDCIGSLAEEVGVRMWRWRGGPSSPYMGVTAQAWDGAAPLPQVEVVLYAGTAVCATPWMRGFAPQRAFLLGSWQDHCQTVDRVHELASGVRRPVEIVHPDAEAASTPFPGAVVPRVQPEDWWRAFLTVTPSR